LKPLERRDRSEVMATLELRMSWGLSDRVLRELITEMGSAVDALRNRRRLRQLRAGVSRPKPGGKNASPSDVMDRADAAGLQACALGCSGYPVPVFDLPDPPAVLWTRGDQSVLGLPGVAVVGARRATESGRRVAYEIGAALAEAGLAVVSGMALGVDGAAHEGALAGGGLTIAVLGSGADRPSPVSHRRLYDRIVRSGVVASEFDPGTRAAPFHFPRRNRVIAALARAVVVVEAAEKSGALITVDHALDLGRAVHAVPGPLDRPQSVGTNGLIRDGAGMVTSVEDMVEVLLEEARPGPSGPRPDARAHPRHNEREDEAPAERGSVSPVEAESSDEVSDALRPLLIQGPWSLDDLVSASGRPVPEVSSTLLELELRGSVRVDGSRYCWVRR